jgi:3-dehydroquinate synthase
LIGLGGGMVGDMTGFAAACYLRGVNYIHVPTSLIAQVDSAVGGKTGVNHLAGKNLIGAFYQPQCVVVDIDLLVTLPAREFVSGLAEIIKYGLIYDGTFFAWLEKNIMALLNRDESVLLHAISRSVSIKADIVAQDEKDRNLRNILNFGHTVGHALEAALGYQNILHGEAVAVGMMVAAELSLMLNLLSAADVARIVGLLRMTGVLRDLPVFPGVDELLGFIFQDKKKLNGRVCFILLKSLGEGIRVADVSVDHIREALEKSVI